MTGRRNLRRGTHPDSFASIQAQMERAEARRRRVLRLATGFAAVGLVVMVLGATLALGSMAPADPAVQVATAAVPATTVSTATPGSEPSASDTASGQASDPEPEQPASEPVPEQPAPDPEPEQPAPDPEPKRPAPPKPSVQRLKLAIGIAGYEPRFLSAKAGIPIELTVGQGEGCAAGFLIQELGVELDNSTGAVTTKLGALDAGDYRFTCGMEMVEGVLRVR